MKTIKEKINTEPTVIIATEFLPNGFFNLCKRKDADIKIQLIGIRKCNKMKMIQTCYFKKLIKK